MAITISTSGVTFSDGVLWTGDVGSLYPDYSTSTTAVNYNVGYLALANTVYSADAGQFLGVPLYAGVLFALNVTNKYWASNSSYYSANPAVNTVYAQDAYFGSQNFYTFGSYYCAGTWKSRGQAISVGFTQGYGNFVLLERVA